MASDGAGAPPSQDGQGAAASLARAASDVEDRGITASELVRQAVHSFGASSVDETRELAALTAELRRAIPGMRKSLRDANAAAERADRACRRDRVLVHGGDDQRRRGDASVLRAMA